MSASYEWRQKIVVEVIGDMTKNFTLINWNALS
jgi:hypothetical protein